MDDTSQLITAMVEECRRVILEAGEFRGDLPVPLQREHLVRMCNRIERHVDDWPVTKLHRWFGFIQCALIANGILDLDDVKAIFDPAKNAFGAMGDDLTDHLDPDNTFELDIGGEG